MRISAPPIRSSSGRTEAIACFRRALELNPNHADAHDNLGVALQSRGEPAAAEACFRRALAHNPNYAEAHFNLGNALQALGGRPRPSPPINGPCN